MDNFFQWVLITLFQFVRNVRYNFGKLFCHFSWLEEFDERFRMLFGRSFILFRDLTRVICAFGTNLIMLCSYSEVPLLNLSCDGLLVTFTFLFSVCSQSLLKAVNLDVIIGMYFASLEGLGLPDGISMMILIFVFIIRGVVRIVLLSIFIELCFFL